MNAAVAGAIAWLLSIGAIALLGIYAGGTPWWALTSALSLASAFSCPCSVQPVEATISEGCRVVWDVGRCLDYERADDPLGRPLRAR